MRIGVFGGTFNPVHYGHLRAAEEVRERLKLSKIIFLPAGRPPLKHSALAGARHRLRMTSLAISGNPRLEVSDIECARAGTSFTVETMLALRAQRPKDRLYFILGADAFSDLPLWKDPYLLVTLCDFVVITRPPNGFGQALDSPFIGAMPVKRGNAPLMARLRGGRKAYFLEVTNVDISSTMIRSLVREGRSAKYLLPAEVESYIIANKLYLDGGDFLKADAGRRQRA